MATNRYKYVQMPFHGDNTSSNPVGDANQINNLEILRPLATATRGTGVAIRPHRRAFRP